MKKKEMALDKFHVREKRYTNAVSFKLPNRRITVGKVKNGDVFIQTKIAYADQKPPVLHEHHKGKVHEVSTVYSPEGAELILIGLADMLGYVICFEPSKEPPCQP